MASSIKGQQNLPYLNELKQKQTQGQTNSGQSVEQKETPATNLQSANPTTKSLVQSHTGDRTSINQMPTPPATSVQKQIGPKPKCPAPKYPQYIAKKTNSASSSTQKQQASSTQVSSSPQDNATTKPNQNSVETKDSTPPQELQKEIKLNQDLVNSLNKITSSFKYKKLTLRSSKRRQMVLDALNKESETTINDATLKNILGDKNCSRGVKTALLLSDKVSLAQKQEILKQDSSGDILAYAQKHKILDQVAYCAVREINVQDLQIKHSIPTRTKTLIDSLFVFDEKALFNLPENIQAAKSFFNPSTFTTKERRKIVQQLEAKKIQDPQADDDKFNNLKIDTAILMFSNDNVEKKCENFNKIFNKIMKEMDSFVNKLPDTMDDDTKNKAEKIEHNCKGIADTINLFHSKAPEGPALNKLWNMNAGQGATRISMPLAEILKKENGASISGAKKEALTRAKQQPTIQKAKYKVCKHYDRLSSEGKAKFVENKFYAFDITGLELKQLCHKEGEKIETTPTSEIYVFGLNDTAMHQVATNLDLLEGHEKFDIAKHTVKYGQKPIFINGKEATAQQIIEIVNSGKVNETKVTVTQVKQNDNGSPVIQAGKLVTEQVEKTLAELLQ